MSLDKTKVVASLTKKGFKKELGKGDHDFYRLYKAGKKTAVYTKVSRGSGKYKVLGPDLISKMARQTKLSKRDFERFVECTLSEESYILQVEKELGPL